MTVIGGAWPDRAAGRGSVWIWGMRRRFFERRRLRGPGRAVAPRAGAVGWPWMSDPPSPVFLQVRVFG